VICKTIIRLNRKEKKNIFKAVKKTKIQNKILAAAATASATSSILSEEEDCESNSSESNYDDTFAVTPARNPNDDTEPMDCTEKGSSDYNIIFKLIFLCFLFFLFSASQDTGYLPSSGWMEIRSPNVEKIDENIL
jgi:hypothetical protein